MSHQKDQDLENRLKRFLDVIPSRRSDSRDSDELAEKIDLLLKEYNMPKVELEPQVLDVKPEPLQQRQRSHSLNSQKRYQPATQKPQLQQPINLKIINQIKLMIKPPEQIVLLAAAFVQLFGGCLQSVCISPFSINQAPSWPEVKSCLQNPVELLQAFNDFKGLLADGRLKKDNLIISMYLLNQAQSRSVQLVESSIQQISDVLTECLNRLHLQARAHYHVGSNVPTANAIVKREPHFKPAESQQKVEPQRQRSASRSLSQSLHNTSNSSVCKKLFETQTRKNLKKVSSITSTPKMPRDQFRTLNTSSTKRLSTSRSKSRSLPKHYDLQKRVQMAQEKKLARIDKILQLQVKKPVVESSVRQLREGRSSHRTSKVIANDPIAQQRIALQEEVALNQAAIRALRHEEMAIKWRVEREAKQIMTEQEKQAQQDEIDRHKREHDLLEQQEIYEKLVKLRELRKKTNESLVRKQEGPQRISRYSDAKENLDISEVQLKAQFIKISQKETECLKNLHADYRWTQKKKEEMEHSLQKIISNINSHGLSDSRNT